MTLFLTGCSVSQQGYNEGPLKSRPKGLQVFSAPIRDFYDAFRETTDLWNGTSWAAQSKTVSESKNGDKTIITLTDPDAQSTEIK